jgi:hypothetical protein
LAARLSIGRSRGWPFRVLRVDDGDYSPLEEPAGGPNFAGVGDNVLCELHIDNNGDGKEDVTYQFRFKMQVLNGNTFLYNTGTIGNIRAV